MFKQTTGVIIGDEFRPISKATEKTFKDILKNFKEKNREDIDKLNDLWNKLNDAAEVIKTKSAEKTVTVVDCQACYRAWEEFHNKLFGSTKEIEILMTNIDTTSDSNPYSLLGYYNKEEGAVITGGVSIDEKGLAYAQISQNDLSGALRQSLEEVWQSGLQDHFSKMLQSVDSETPTRTEVIYVHDKGLAPYRKSKKGEDDKLGGVQHRRMEALYKNYGFYKERYPYKKLVATQGETTTYGRWQEVFFSHIAKRHAEEINSLMEDEGDNFSFLSLKNINLKDKPPVLREERNAWPGGLYAAGLMESDNRTFVTGGDFIMADKNGKILTNLQLKMGRNTFKGNAISMNVIFSYIDKIKRILEPKNPDTFDEAAKDFYKSQQTAAWVQVNGRALTRIANKTVKDVFDETKFKELEGIK